jgi:hypothetical protein
MSRRERGTADVIAVLGALATGAVGGISLFAPATLLKAVGEGNQAVNAGTQIFANYTGTRNLAAALVLLALVVMRSGRVLAGLLITVALTNFLDAITDLAAQRWPAIPGPIIFSIAFMAAALLLLERADEPQTGSSV